MMCIKHYGGIGIFLSDLPNNGQANHRSLCSVGLNGSAFLQIGSEEVTALKLDARAIHEGSSRGTRRVDHCHDSRAYWRRE
jgi:hypothetical protein